MPAKPPRTLDPRAAWSIIRGTGAAVLWPREHFRGAVIGRAIRRRLSCSSGLRRRRRHPRRGTEAWLLHLSRAVSATFTSQTTATRLLNDVSERRLAGTRSKSRKVALEIRGPCRTHAESAESARLVQSSSFQCLLPSSP
jgi:hypothetical protein